MLTLFIYILPILAVVFCHIFYTKYIDRDNSSFFVPRLGRIVILLFSFIPIVSWICAGIWIYVFFSCDTEFKSNKITDFFINN